MLYDACDVFYDVFCDVFYDVFCGFCGACGAYVICGLYEFAIDVHVETD